MFPHFFPVNQHVTNATIEDIEDHVRRQMTSLLKRVDVKPGMRIAIGTGSRGIQCIKPVIGSVVSVLRQQGADPFLVPAMGSHGGGTAEGQRDVLIGYGLGTGGLELEIQSDMEPYLIAHTPPGMPVYFDANAAQADAIMLVNRIKPHTSFRAPWESGLFKMLTVGFGKRNGASTLHNWGIEDAIPAAADIILNSLPVLGGIGIVENGHHRPAHIEAIAAADIRDREPELLQLAMGHLPRIPIEPIDLLVLQEMGKDISGTGMDLNIIGMWRRNGGVISPKIERLAVLDLTENSHGNATGMGYADIITQRLRKKVDIDATVTNCLTSNNFSGARIPITTATDYDALQLGLPGIDHENARIVIARNTLDLQSFRVSTALAETIEAHDSLEVAGPAEPLLFDEQKNLLLGI